ncbi:MAG: c-type cytochrome [Oceanospirillaceae bacterium]
MPNKTLLIGGFILASTMFNINSTHADGSLVTAPQWSTPQRSSINWNEPQGSQTQQLEGSERSYSFEQIDNKYSAPIWFPNPLSPMPPIVQFGKGKKVWACASCHLASGMGHPESSRLAGLSSDYMQKQMQAFKTGDRVDYSGHMNRMAPLITAAETKEIADWFATLKPIKWYDVIEQMQVPRTIVDNTRMRILNSDAYPDTENTLEDINQRIIELPTDILKVKKRSPTTGFTAYVEPGSIKRGKEASTKYACNACHGAFLQGSIIAPNIAGISPIYLVRQLYSFKNGQRKGENSDKGAMMSNLSKQMKTTEISDLASYIATLKPQGE